MNLKIRSGKGIDCNEKWSTGRWVMRVSKRSSSTNVKIHSTKPANRSKAFSNRWWVESLRTNDLRSDIVLQSLHSNLKRDSIKCSLLNFIQTHLRWSIADSLCSIANSAAYSLYYSSLSIEHHPHDGTVTQAVQWQRWREANSIICKRHKKQSTDKRRHLSS